ncbi:MAG: N-acetylmuramoyl-L-alanine amidase [Verrucomicrobia bacterium]|nr:N-acetylmuramoyl-L-alanine amidase [Verrucomicrobiota bacterium]
MLIRPLLILCASFSFWLSIFSGSVDAADNLGILGTKPTWDVLEHYQRTITRDEFIHMINDVYCTHGIPDDLIKIDNEAARIVTTQDPHAEFTLQFAPDENSKARIPRLWRPAKSLPPAKLDKPLAGLRIALDPGHLGGKWAKMEERWFQVGDSKPVTEGDLTLRVSRMLAARLRKLGAIVLFVRNSTQPVTSKRPADFKKLARKILIKNGVPRPRDEVLNPKDPDKEGTIKFQSEILFYRYSEIRRRAVLVNTKLHPDLVVCLHFNAEGWGDPANPTLVDVNHLHLLVNGSYLQDELQFDDERFEMIRRLLSRAYDEDLPITEAVATSMAKATGLPPYQYPTTLTATKVGSNGYVYARNLLANRLYRCPVVYCEPYVMNSNDGFARIQAGDYDGMKEINGVQRKSIFREYADSVAEGLRDYYSSARSRRD